MKYLQSEKIVQIHVRTHTHGTQSKVSLWAATTTWLEFAMSILTYFKQKDGFPNPKDPLLLSIPSQVIALVIYKVHGERYYR